MYIHLDEEGCVPAGKICPFIGECFPLEKDLLCPRCADLRRFSCALARAFELLLRYKEEGKE